MSLLTKIFVFISIMKGGVVLVDVYVALIVKGRRSLDQVPLSLKEQVSLELAALGLDGNGNAMI